MDIDRIIERIAEPAPEAKPSQRCYGNVRYVSGRPCVVVDGSTVPTPCVSTATVADGDRVVCEVRDHRLVVTGNLSDRSASAEELRRAGEAVVELERVSAELVTAKELYAQKLTAVEAQVGDLEADVIAANEITASKLDADAAAIKLLEAEAAKIASLTAEQIRAACAYVGDLEAGGVKASDIEAVKAEIGELFAGQIKATAAYVAALVADGVTAEKVLAMSGQFDTLSSDYIQAGFANLTRADVESFYAKQGMIGSVIIRDSTVTGELVAVSFSGDAIEANTVKADRLLLKGDDGLYYAINASALDGKVSVEELTEAEQEQLRGGIHGEAIIAESITADKITVGDLSAFGATIGGWQIDQGAIRTGKEGFGDGLGAYLGADGRFDLGSGDQFIRFDPVTGELAIQTNSIFLKGGSSLDDIFKLYMKFDGRNMELGHVDNDTRMRLANDGLAIVEGAGTLSERFATYISNRTMYTGNSTVMDSLRINNFVWQRRVNGNMSLKCLDGEGEGVAIPDEIYGMFGVRKSLEDMPGVVAGSGGSESIAVPFSKASLSEGETETVVVTASGNGVISSVDISQEVADGGARRASITEEHERTGRNVAVTATGPGEVGSVTVAIRTVGSFQLGIGVM